MTTSISFSVSQAQRILENVQERLENDQVGFTDEMLETIRALDEYYKGFCSEIDTDYEQPPGTTYNNDCGPNIEFYIEADDWHQISKAFRKVFGGSDE